MNARAEYVEGGMSRERRSAQRRQPCDLRLGGRSHSDLRDRRLKAMPRGGRDLMLISLEDKDQLASARPPVRSAQSAWMAWGVAARRVPRDAGDPAASSNARGKPRPQRDKAAPTWPAT